MCNDTSFLYTLLPLESKYGVTLLNSELCFGNYYMYTCMYMYMYPNAIGCGEEEPYVYTHAYMYNGWYVNELFLVSGYGIFDDVM